MKINTKHLIILYLLSFLFLTKLPHFYAQVQAQEDITFEEFTVPTSNSMPFKITLGPDGNLWFTEYYANKIGKITPNGSITEFPIPTSGSGLGTITSGPDGNLWFTESNANKIGRITTNGVINEYPIQTNASYPADIITGPDGNLWFTESNGNKIGRITPSGIITEFPVISSESRPGGINPGSDGNLWFTEYNTNSIGKITNSGVVTEFTVPTNNSLPQNIILGPDNNVWFTETLGNKIGRITTIGTITEFLIPTINSNPNSITRGHDGNLWFVEDNGNKIGKITPAGIITEYNIPTANSRPRGIVSDTKGNIWFTEWATNKIGRINLSTPFQTHFKQTDPQWANDIFDHASDGQFLCGTTMAQCGCATTSIAMVLNSYGIKKLPDGTVLNPGTLNTWLKENNGYDRNVGVIWPVAATIANKAKSENPEFKYDTLEFDSNRTFDLQRLSDDLQNNIPNILQVDAPGMHFIVASDENENNFTINDPFFDYQDLSSYNNQANSVRRYIPANSDMSYIVYVVDKDVNITVKDENGNNMGETYLEYSPANLTSNPTYTESSAVNVYYFSKPATGNYFVELKSNNSSNFLLDEVLISQDGGIKKDSFEGSTDLTGLAEYKLTFDKQSVSDSSTSLLDTTPPISTSNVSAGTLGFDDWYTNDVTVSLGAMDGGSGVDKTEYSLNNSVFSTYTDPISISTEGINELKFRSTDKAGNIESDKTTTIKIDKTPPATLLYLSWTKGNPDWYGSNAIVTLNSTDNLTTVPLTYYKLDDSDYSEYISPVTISKEGASTLSYYSVDEAGNKETEKIKTIKIDKTPPILSISANPSTIWPPNGKMVNVNITGNSTDTNLYKTTFNIIDEYGLIEPAITGFNQTIKLEAKRNGTDKDGRIYTITAIAEDLAGNQSQAITHVTVPHDQK